MEKQLHSCVYILLNFIFDTQSGRNMLWAVVVEIKRAQSVHENSFPEGRDRKNSFL